MENYKKIIDYVELVNIKQDLELIEQLFSIINPCLTPFLIPYVSLFCYEIEIYFKNKGQALDIPKKSIYVMSEIRNKAKCFNLKSMQKIINTNANIDNIQNENFANMMKYPSLKKLNFHDNLGIYYLNDKNIFNTQYVAYISRLEKCISNKKVTNSKELINEEIKKYGYDLGIIIGNVSRGFSEIDMLTPFKLKKDDDILTYSDFNTNKIFKNQNIDYKALNLFILHLTSNIGFVIYVLKELIIKDNGLLLKIEYILYHYMINSLWSIYNNCVQNRYYDNIRLENCINDIKGNIEVVPKKNSLYNSYFRSGIFHYGLFTLKTVLF